MVCPGTTCKDDPQVGEDLIGKSTNARPSSPSDARTDALFASDDDFFTPAEDGVIYMPVQAGNYKFEIPQLKCSGVWEVKVQWEGDRRFYSSDEVDALEGNSSLPSTKDLEGNTIYNQDGIASVDDQYVNWSPDYGVLGTGETNFFVEKVDRKLIIRDFDQDIYYYNDVDIPVTMQGLYNIMPFGRLTLWIDGVKYDPRLDTGYNNYNASGAIDPDAWATANGYDADAELTLIPDCSTLGNVYSGLHLDPYCNTANLDPWANRVADMSTMGDAIPEANVVFKVRQSALGIGQHTIEVTYEGNESFFVDHNDAWTDVRSNIPGGDHTTTGDPLLEVAKFNPSLVTEIVTDETDAADLRMTDDGPEIMTSTLGAKVRFTFTTDCALYSSDYSQDIMNVGNPTPTMQTQGGTDAIAEEILYGTGFKPVLTYTDPTTGATVVNSSLRTTNSPILTDWNLRTDLSAEPTTCITAPETGKAPAAGALATWTYEAIINRENILEASDYNFSVEFTGDDNQNGIAYNDNNPNTTDGNLPAQNDVDFIVVKTPTQFQVVVPSEYPLPYSNYEFRSDPLDHTYPIGSEYDFAPQMLAAYDNGAELTVDDTQVEVMIEVKARGYNPTGKIFYDSVTHQLTYDDSDTESTPYHLEGNDEDGLPGLYFDYYSGVPTGFALVPDDPNCGLDMTKQLDGHVGVPAADLCKSRVVITVLYQVFAGVYNFKADFVGNTTLDASSNLDSDPRPDDVKYGPDFTDIGNIFTVGQVEPIVSEIHFDDVPTDLKTSTDRVHVKGHFTTGDINIFPTGTVSVSLCRADYVAEVMLDDGPETVCNPGGTVSYEHRTDDTGPLGANVTPLDDLSEVDPLTGVTYITGTGEFELDLFVKTDELTWGDRWGSWTLIINYNGDQNFAINTKTHPIVFLPASSALEVDREPEERTVNHHELDFDVKVYASGHIATGMVEYKIEHIGGTTADNRTLTKRTPDIEGEVMLVPGYDLDYASFTRPEDTVCGYYPLQDWDNEPEDWVPGTDEDDVTCHPQRIDRTCPSETICVATAHVYIPEIYRLFMGDYQISAHYVGDHALRQSFFPHPSTLPDPADECDGDANPEQALIGGTYDWFGNLVDNGGYDVDGSYIGECWILYEDGEPEAPVKPLAYDPTDADFGVNGFAVNALGEIVEAGTALAGTKAGDDTFPARVAGSSTVRPLGLSITPLAADADAEPEEFYTTKTTCEKVGYFWWENTCLTPVIDDFNGAYAFTNPAAGCKAAGFFWWTYTSTCLEPEFDDFNHLTMPDEAPEAAEGCTTAGYFWWDWTNNCLEPSPGDFNYSYADNDDKAEALTTCRLVGFFWYGVMPADPICTDVAPIADDFKGQPEECVYHGFFWYPELTSNKPEGGYDFACHSVLDGVFYVDGVHIHYIDRGVEYEDKVQDYEDAFVVPVPKPENYPFRFSGWYLRDITQGAPFKYQENNDAFAPVPKVENPQKPSVPVSDHDRDNRRAYVKSLNVVDPSTLPPPIIFDDDGEPELLQPGVSRPLHFPAYHNEVAHSDFDHPFEFNHPSSGGYDTSSQVFDFGPHIVYKDIYLESKYTNKPSLRFTIDGVDVSETYVGDHDVVIGSGFAPHEFVEIEMHSAIIPLGEVYTDEHGGFEFPMVTPDPGDREHHDIWAFARSHVGDADETSAVINVLLVEDHGGGGYRPKKEECDRTLRYDPNCKYWYADDEEADDNKPADTPTADKKTPRDKADWWSTPLSEWPWWWLPAIILGLLLFLALLLWLLWLLWKLRHPLKIIIISDEEAQNDETELLFAGQVRLENRARRAKLRVDEINILPDFEEDELEAGEILVLPNPVDIDEEVQVKYTFHKRHIKTKKKRKK